MGPINSHRDDRLLQAREAVLDQRFDAALKMCQAEIRPDETETDWLLLRAQARIGLGKGFAALDDLFSVLRQNNEEAEAFFRIGQIFLDADEAPHAERYLQRAVDLSGGKKSYSKLHRQAHKRALREDSRLDAPQSSLPSAEDIPDLDSANSQAGGDGENVLQALDRLFAFEQEMRLFSSRLDNALSMTRDAIPKFRDVGRSRQLRRAALFSGIGLAALLLIVGIGLLVLRAWHGREHYQSQLAALDLAMSQGKYAAREEAIKNLQQGADFDDEDLALRSAWLFLSRYQLDSFAEKDLKQALDLLAPYADSTEPMAVLGRAYANQVRGQSLGAQVLTEMQSEAKYESLRQELLTLDSLNKRNYAAAVRHVSEAMKERSQSLQLQLLMVRACIAGRQFDEAEKWLKSAQKNEAQSPRLALYQASLQWSQGAQAAEVAKALRPAIDSPAWQIKLDASLLAVDLRAALGSPDDPAPKIDDINALVEKDPARVHLAAWQLIRRGWPILAKQLLKSSGIEANPEEHFAIVAGQGDVDQAQNSASAAGLRSAIFAADLALRAASLGEISTSDALLTRMEVLSINPCELAATRARIAFRRGLTADAKVQQQLDACPLSGAMLLYEAERRAFSVKLPKDSKNLIKIKQLKAKKLRKALLRSPDLAMQRFIALGLFDLQRAQITQSDEAGRIIQQRCPKSRSAIALRLRAAMASGDYPAMNKLYAALDDEAKSDAELVGLLAWGRLSRGNTSSVKRFIARSEANLNPQGQALTLSAIKMASLNKRKAQKMLKAIAQGDPSPYIIEAIARIYLVLGKEKAVAKALDAIHAAPERKLYRILLRAELAKLRGDKRDYIRQIKTAGKAAQRDYNNAPVVAEAAMRIAVLRSSKSSRQDAIDSAQEAINDLASYDKGAVYLKNLSRLGRRYRSKQQEIKP